MYRKCSKKIWEELQQRNSVNDDVVECFEEEEYFTSEGGIMDKFFSKGKEYFTSEGETSHFALDGKGWIKSTHGHMQNDICIGFVI